MHRLVLVVCLCLAPAGCALADTLAVWNFNDAISGTTGGQDEFLVDRGIGTMTSDFLAQNVLNYAGTGLNSVEGDPAGRALGLASSINNGKDLSWMVDTTGYESIATSFAIQRSSTGFSDNQLQYTVDSGASWITFGPNFVPDLTYGVQSFDLTALLALNDNLGVGFRILFGGATASTGNNRIDNLFVSGNKILAPPSPSAVPEPSTATLLAGGLACLLCGSRKRAIR